MSANIFNHVSFGRGNPAVSVPRNGERTPMGYRAPGRLSRRNLGMIPKQAIITILRHILCTRTDVLSFISKGRDYPSIYVPRRCVASDRNGNVMEETVSFPSSNLSSQDC